VRSLRLSAIAFLLLCLSPCSANAQQFVCGPIARGETVSSAARRLTGRANSAYGPSFQIRDSARGLFVPKSQYQHLHSDWEACVAAPATTLAEPAKVADEPATAPKEQPLETAPLSVTRASGALVGASPVSTIGAVALVTLLLAAAIGSLARRQIPPAARLAGENFVAVFARPLIDTSTAAPPIETRLRFVRRKQQLEISIAPGPGRRYPNLSDHKKNLAYDVDRVMQVLGTHVLCRPPRAAGKWVVVTIRPMGGET
jgi:hypothetical protein